MGLTLKECDILAAWKAAPKAMLSSPFKWSPTSRSPKYLFNVYYIFGILMPPPINSTTLTSAKVLFAFSSTFSIG